MIDVDLGFTKFRSEKLLGSPRVNNVTFNTEKVTAGEPEVMMHANRAEPGLDMQQSNTESFFSAQSNFDHSPSEINSETSDSC